MSKLLRFLFKQWIRFLDALGFLNFMILVAILFVLAIWLSGCTTYEHEFLADCVRVNAETIKCDVCGNEYLADFPVKENKVQIKSRIQYCSSMNCGELYFFYGGKWDRVRLPQEDARAIYDCYTEDWEDDDDWYGYEYDDTTPDTSSIPARKERLTDGTLTEDAINQARINAKQAKEYIEKLKAQGWGKVNPTTTSTKDWRE